MRDGNTQRMILIPTVHMTPQVAKFYTLPSSLDYKTPLTSSCADFAIRFTGSHSRGSRYLLFLHRSTSAIESWAISSCSADAPLHLHYFDLSLVNNMSLRRTIIHNSRWMSLGAIYQGPNYGNSQGITSELHEIQRDRIV